MPMLEYVQVAHYVGPGYSTWAHQLDHSRIIRIVRASAHSECCRVRRLERASVFATRVRLIFTESCSNRPLTTIIASVAQRRYTILFSRDGLQQA